MEGNKFKYLIGGILFWFRIQLQKKNIYTFNVIFPLFEKKNDTLRNEFLMIRI